MKNNSTILLLLSTLWLFANIFKGPYDVMFIVLNIYIVSYYIVSSIENLNK